MTRHVGCYLALVAGALLSGCVTPGGQQQAHRPTAADDPSQSCFLNLTMDKRFDAIRYKVAIREKATQAPLEMLADKTYPTDEERRTLNVWKIARDVCADSGASYRAQYAPADYRASIDAGFIRFNGLIARLYARDITYGEFNRARAENAAISNQEIASVQQREREANAAAAAQEDERRRAAVGMALQNLQNQQMLQQQQNQLNRPRTTNCQRIGSQMNCTTY